MIEFDDVFVLYRGTLHDVVALRGLNLSVKEGERVVVHGPSGSGKSTLIKVVTTQVAPSAGRVKIMGRVLEAAPPRRTTTTTPRVGLVTQGTGRDLVPELSCLENIALQARFDGANRATALAAAGAVLHRFGLDHLATRRPGSLSNGEAQRIGLASALACEPSVIVADEPTGELDGASAEAVYDLLSEQIRATGASLLLVTHDVRAARIADRTITIRDGRVSSEHAGGRDLVIVDPRGWVRLSQPELRASGIGDRAAVSADATGVTIRPPAHRPARVAPPAPSGAAASGAVARTSTEAGAELLRADGVRVNVNGTVVLSPVSIALKRGQLTAIVGRSGSGKTTLLSLIAGLTEPSSGTIDRSPRLTRSISVAVAGFAEQLSVRDNVAVACGVRRKVAGTRSGAAGPLQTDEANHEATHEATEALLDALGIAALRDRLIHTLSGGERQRVSIVRALVTGADLVLLDEPTSQLDEASAAQVAALLAQLAADGRTIVCTTHDLGLEALADQVVRLDAQA